MILLIVIICICVCMLIASAALKEDDEHAFVPKFQIPERAKNALFLGTGLSFLLLAGIVIDLFTGGIKPYGKLAFRQGRFVPVQKALEYDDEQLIFLVRFQEYSFWGARKKGDWPARWKGDDVGWEVYRDNRWASIVFDIDDGEGYDWDNRGTYSR